MRQNKFKVWDKTNKKWLDTKDLLLNSEGELVIPDDQGGYLFDEVDYVIVFSTGQKDKKQVEIFEYDVVKFGFGEFEWGVVKFGTGSFDSGAYNFIGFYLAVPRTMYDPKKNKLVWTGQFYEDATADILMHDDEYIALEVIGSIFKNPRFRKSELANL